MCTTKQPRPIRLRLGVQIVASVLAGGVSVGVLAAGAELPNLLSDPNFSLGNWRSDGGRMTTVPFASIGGRNAGCIPLTATLKKNDAGKPENLMYLPRQLNLVRNTKYRLTYSVRAYGGSRSGARVGTLMASVTATEYMTNTGVYMPMVYAEHQNKWNSNTFKTYTLDFVTPEVGIGQGAPAARARYTEVMFQAISDDDTYPESGLCVADVKLTELGSNDAMELGEVNPTSPRIRYNQVVAAPETPASTSGTYFTIMNPPLQSTIQMVTGSGASEKIVRERKITAYDYTGPKNDGTENVDPHTKQFRLYSYNDYWNAPAKLRLLDTDGKTVLAETETIPFGGNTPYSSYAPSLRRDALHFFYAQRAGQDIIDRRYQATGYRNWLDRPAGHKNEAATCFSGRDKFGNDFSGACKTAAGIAMPPRDVSGGWYDAGDQGKYVVNGATALWALQNVIEYHRSRGTLESMYPDGMLKYGTNGVSDLLDEAKYEMAWLLKMQINESLTVRVPAGNNFDGKDAPTAIWDTPNEVNVAVSPRRYRVRRGKIVLDMKEIDAKGMVFSAVHDDTWTSIPTAPAADTKARVLDYPTTIATLNFAAVAAQAYRIWKDTDPVFANQCLEAAKKAWNAALANPQVFRYGEYSDALNIPLRAITVGGGAYADSASKDAISWAALELYLASSSLGGTDSEEAVRFLKAVPLGSYGGADGFTISGEAHAESFSWKNTKNMGLMSLIVNGRDGEFVAKAKAAGKTVKSPLTTLQAWADAMAENVKASPFGVPHTLAEIFNWASNADIANSGGMFAFASKFVNKYRTEARRTMSYLLGHNPLGKSFVTGYGSNPARNPHHRFWAKHAHIDYPAAPPGMLVGGPNGKWEGAVLAADLVNGNWSWPNDKAAEYYMRNLASNCNAYESPSFIVYNSQKQGGISCYADRNDLYMVNEVAINWNAALFWLSAYLD